MLVINIVELMLPVISYDSFKTVHGLNEIDCQSILRLYFVRNQGLPIFEATIVSHEEINNYSIV
jgi:hypothetical protein